jgi:transcriptional pleiotropic regulator of transition state genes
MIRKVDELGRIVLPIEYRDALNIQEKDELEISLKTDEITIRKPILGCHFCGAAVNLVQIGNECVCKLCIERLHNARVGEVLYPKKVD